MKTGLHKGGNAGRVFKVMADSAAASAMTLIVVLVFILFPLSFSRFNTAQTMREQYNLMDAYFTISNHVGKTHPYHNTSREIVVVDIRDIYDRDTLADLLTTIVSAKPLAVGLDVMFEQRKSERADSVIAAVAALPEVVSPVILSSEDRNEDASFVKASMPFYMTDLKRNAGFVNVAASGASQTCRFFARTLRLGNTHVPNFDLAILRAVSPSAFEDEMDRGTDVEYINYNLSSFSIFSAASVPYNLDLLKGKVVLVGDRGDLADQHVTPVGARVPGVDIHAMTLATMLEDRHVDVMSEFGAWVLAFLVTLAIMPVIRLMRRNEWTSMFYPVLQTLLIVAAVFVCYLIFVSYGYYVRVVYALLAIGFIDFGNNLYLKLKGLCGRLLSH